MNDKLRNLSKRIKRLRRLESCLEFSKSATSGLASTRTTKAAPVSSEEELSKLLSQFLGSLANLQKIERSDSAVASASQGAFGSISHKRQTKSPYSMISEIEQLIKGLERIEEDCEKAAPKIDVYYVIDLSSSMGQLYGDGAGSKMDAAKSAIIQTTNLINSWTNGSRYGIITFWGGQHGVGNPATYEVVTTNQFTFIPFITNGLIDDPAKFSNKINRLYANGSTPTSHAIRFAYPELARDGISANTPTFILLSDGVPTLSQNRNSYDDLGVQAIPLKSGDEWLTSEQVRSSSPFGIPLADTMVAIEDMYAVHPFKMHCIGIQGQDNNIFNSAILEYIAYVSGGTYFDVFSLSQLNAVLQATVQG